MPMDVILKIKDQIGGGDEPPQSAWEELGDSMALGWKQRLAGFGAFMLMSAVCFILSVTFAPMIVILPKKFAFFFTCANLFGVASTTFLVGPSRQLRSMGEHNRMLTTMAYLGSMFMTLMAAVKWRNTMMVIVFCCIQVAALVWYSLSYIPYARHLASYFLGPLLKGCMACTQTCCVGFGKCCGMLIKK